jgi:FkbM family methyltransferase
VMARYLRNLMPLPSKLRFILWRIAPLAREITFSLRTGEVLTMRRAPNLDLEVAFEVFASKIYLSPRPLRADSVRCVVDIGANVGYTVVFLARSFPDAQIVAFEPHPDNARIAMRNIAANHLDGRTTLHVAAAGITPGPAYLTDDSSASRVNASRNHKVDVLPVKMMDFFETIGSREVDLLKIDCEGGEYDIVMDPRFESLNARAVAMEWHRTLERPRADTELIGRLRECGWDVVPMTAYSTPFSDFQFLGNGLLWGYRR